MRNREIREKAVQWAMDNWKACFSEEEREEAVKACYYMDTFGVYFKNIAEDAREEERGNRQNGTQWHVANEFLKEIIATASKLELSELLEIIALEDRY